MSYFEELGVFDRPFVDVKAVLHGKEVPLQARALSAKDADAIDALQLDEYGRLLQKFTEPVDGSVNEVERVERVYAAQSHPQVVRQLLQTRGSDIEARAIEISGIDMQATMEEMRSLPDDDAREAFAKSQNEILEEARKTARAEVKHELEAQDVSDLAHTLAQVSTNVRAQIQAGQATNAAFLFYTIYRPDTKERAFTSIDEVTEMLSPAKIVELADAVRRALATDIPFGSQGDEEPSTPPSSQRTSKAATPAGGKRTTTTKGASKRSTTPSSQTS